MNPDTGTIVYVRGDNSKVPHTKRWTNPTNPTNPRTPLQQQNRDLFRQANQGWKSESPVTKTLWNQTAKEYPHITGQTLYISRWLKFHKTHNQPPAPGFLPNQEP
jgi:hypothetical protein